MDTVSPQLRYFTSFAQLHDAFLLLNQQRDRNAKGEERGKNWMFRGHARASWPLQTSFDRLALRFGIDSRDRADVEREMLRQYKRQAQIHFSDANLLPADNHTFQWLALMQHYGAPTRLLDWTYSFYIALYFAVSDYDPGADKEMRQHLPDASDDSWGFAIWVLDMGFIDGLAMNTLWPHRLRELRSADNGRREAPSMNAQLGLDPEVPIDTPYVVCMSPFASNKRLAVQQGTFIVPSPVSETFEGGLSKVLSKAPAGDVPKVFQKWVCQFSPAEFAATLEVLSRMNLTAEALFGGLEAWTKSLVQRCARPGFYMRVETSRAEREWH